MQFGRKISADQEKPWGTIVYSVLGVLDVLSPPRPTVGQF